MSSISCVDRVQIDRDSGTDTFAITAHDDRPVLADQVQIRIARKGTCNEMLMYPAYEICGNEVTFKWGDKIRTLPKGRYEGTFYIDGKCCPCSSVELVVKRDCKIEHIDSSKDFSAQKQCGKQMVGSETHGCEEQSCPMPDPCCPEQDPCELEVCKD